MVAAPFSAGGIRRGSELLPDPSDTTYLADYAYLLRSDDGSVRVEHDRHIEGLFARADWLRLLSEVGFEPSVEPFEQSDSDACQLEVFVGKRPRRTAP